MGEDPAGRVLRVTQDKHLCTDCDGPFDTSEVEDIFTVVINMGDSEEGTLREGRGAEERWVRRGGGDDCITRLPHGAAGNVQAAYKAGQPHDPLGFHGPCMRALQHAHERLKEVIRRQRVAEHPMGHVPVERRNNSWRGFEVHIRHPQGDDVSAFVFVPFKARGIAAFYRGIEVV